MHAGNSKGGAVADHVNSKSDTFQSISFGTNDIRRWSSLESFVLAILLNPVGYCDSAIIKLSEQ